MLELVKLKEKLVKFKDSRNDKKQPNFNLWKKYDHEWTVLMNFELEFKN